MSVFPFCKSILACSDFVDKLSLIEFYRQDNIGSIWLRDNFPHLMSQLDDMTQNWSLLPKTIVRNADILTQMVATYRSNMNCAVPDDIQQEEQIAWKQQVESVLTFLEGSVLKALQHMPNPVKEEDKTDAFAEAFAEDDIDTDDEGEEQEV